MSQLRRNPTPPKRSSKIQILSNSDQQIISNLQQRLEEQKADITSRTNSLQDLRGKMELISNRMKGEQDQAKTLQQRYEECLRRIDYLEGELFKANKELEASATLEKQIADLQFQNSSLRKQLEETKTLIQSKDDAYDVQAVQNSQLRSEILSLTQQLKTLRAEREAQKEDFQQKLGQVQASLEASTEAQKRQALEIRQNTATIARQEQTIQNLQDEKARLTAQLRQTEKRVEEEREERERKKREWEGERLALAEQWRREKEALLADAEKERVGMRQQEDKAHEGMEDLRRTIESLNKREAELTRKLSEAETESKEKEKIIEVKNDLLKEKDKILEERVQALNKQHEKDKETWRKKNEELNALLQSYKRTQEQLRQAEAEQAKAMQAVLEERERQLADKEEKMREREKNLQSEISRLEGLLVSMKKRVKTLQDEGADKDEEIAQLKAEVSRLQAMNPEHKKEALIQCENQLKAAVEKVSKAVTAIETDLTCMCCMGVFDEPMTLIPCGHVMCKKCCERSKDENGNIICSECQMAPEEAPHGGVCGGMVPCHIVDIVTGKLTFQKQTVGDLRHSIATLTSTTRSLGD